MYLRARASHSVKSCLTASAAWFFLASPCFALDSSTPGRTGLVDETQLATLMSACGIAEEARVFAHQSQASMVAELQDTGRKEILDKGRVLAASMFGEDRIVRLFRKRLADGMDPASVAIEVDFCTSPVGKKAMSLRRKFEQSDEMMERFAKRYEAEPAPQHRISWATRVDNAIAGSRAMIDVQQAVVSGILDGMNQMLPPSDRKSKEVITYILSGMHLQTEKIARNAAIAGFMATFDELSDEEFAAYSQHLISPSGKLFHRLKFQGYIEFANSAAEQMGEAMAAVVSPR